MVVVKVLDSVWLGQTIFVVYIEVVVAIVYSASGVVVAFGQITP